MALIPEGVNLIQYNLPPHNYCKEQTDKSQIVLHHTCNNGSAMSCIDWWSYRLGGKGTIATCIVIDKNGDVYQAFSSKYWAYSIGLGVKALEKMIVAIELASWGGLRFRGGKYRAYTGAIIPEENVVLYNKPFRGYQAFERYTDAQIKSAILMTKYFAEKFEIPITFEYEKMFEHSKDAVKGVSGLYSHVSYRKDKSDCHPQPSLIQALKEM